MKDVIKLNEKLGRMAFLLEDSIKDLKEIEKDKLSTHEEMKLEWAMDTIQFIADQLKG